MTSFQYVFVFKRLVIMAFFCAVLSVISCTTTTKDSDVGRTEASKVAIPTNNQKFKSLFSEKECRFPPEVLDAVIFKKEHIIEIWGTKNTGDKTKLKAYALAPGNQFINSQLIGPKLLDADRRLPEGRYQLSSTGGELLLDFPNAFDHRKQLADHRPSFTDRIVLAPVSNLRKNAIGVSDEDYLELAYLVEQAENNSLYIFPNKPGSKAGFDHCSHCPDWSAELYDLLWFHYLKFSRKE